ncbi:MAG: cupin domain-containing protein [Acidobacteria bacterium]|nr:MAG: cupin domain-containing protein [Acidobacteriota bacterium]
MPRRIEKPWGHEEIWAETEDYVGKILVVRKGERLSLQYHRLKVETLYLESGRVLCTVGDENLPLTEKILTPGDVVHLPAGRRHRFEALEDSRLFEVSTPFLDDVVRLEDDYQRDSGD